MMGALMAWAAVNISGLLVAVWWGYVVRPRWEGFHA